MENTTNKVYEQAPIADFTTASQERLSSLISEWGLSMSLRDLQYCQNQYRMRERRNPTVEELRLLDALYRKRTDKAERLGIRSFYTSDPIVAQTYADIIAKASALHRENRPYTPEELSGVLTKTLVQAGKKVSVSSLKVGTQVPVSTAIEQASIEASATLQGVPAYICGPSAKEQPLSQGSDHILLLSPAGLSPAAFAAALRSLNIPSTAQSLVIGENGLFETLLKWDGVYLVLNYLPGVDDDFPLSSLVDTFTDSILIRLEGEHALKLRDSAAELGLTASVIGKYMPNNRLTVRRQDRAPIQLETAFLRSFSPILPIDMEIPEISASDDSIPTPATQSVCPRGDCMLFTSATVGTPYGDSEKYLITGSTSFDCQNPFRSALYTTVYAINRAVAAGADYTELTLCKHLSVPASLEREARATEMMAAIIGSYRVQAELAIPDINGRIVSSSACARTDLSVFAAAEHPEKPVPYTFTAGGNNVYLLSPLRSDESLIDFEDYRKMLRYIHRLCKEGIALSALAVGPEGTETAVQIMTQGGHGFTAAEKLPQAPCSFLIESKQTLQGVLIGVTTAAPYMHIGTKEYAVPDLKMPHIAPQDIPMSRIGIQTPTVFVPQTRDIGDLTPLQSFAEKHHARSTTMLLNRPDSRMQMTKLAELIRHANISVLMGTTQELDQIMRHPRVAYAVEQVTREQDGLILCLHTDRDPAKNAAVPHDHPFFFGTPAALYAQTAVSFEGERAHIVHMNAQNPAVARMLACAIAYFQ